MAARSTHFRVGNGDMMLVEFESGHRLLVDINIRTAADDTDDDTPDVAAQLRARLPRDAQGRLYVDAFLLTHPDADHIRGLMRHFHLGPLDEWSSADDKIVIREMWSSPMVFRRASTNHILCDDAKAWNTEARRRVQAYRDTGGQVDGDRITILGEDVNGKTDDIAAIVVPIDGTFQTIAGIYDPTFQARLLAPLPPGDDAEEDILSKNNSSVVLNLTLHSPGQVPTNYLVGGDAQVAIWERIWARNKHQSCVLAYDLLISPHHCSWHSLSYDSWSDYREDAVVSPDARKALGQAKAGAYVLASSKPVLDDDCDPPCIRAKREYLAILSGVNGTFRCIGDGQDDEPFEFAITRGGIAPKARAAAVTSPFVSVIGRQPVPHG